MIMRVNFGKTRKTIALTFLLLVVLFVVASLVVILTPLALQVGEIDLVRIAIPSIVFGLTAFMTGETVNEVMSKKKGNEE